MITRAFCLRDVKAGTYGIPFFQSTDALAVRTCKDLVMDERSVPHRYPSDFELFYLGEYDDATGKFSFGSLMAPKFILALNSLVEVAK